MRVRGAMHSGAVVRRECVRCARFRTPRALVDKLRTSMVEPPAVSGIARRLVSVREIATGGVFFPMLADARLLPTRRSRI